MGCGPSAPSADDPEGKVAPGTPKNGTPRQKEEAKQKVLDFHALMKSEEGRKALLAFAEQEHSEENVLFYEKAQSFRSSHCSLSEEDMTEEKVAEMRKEATELIDTFLKQNAEYELSVSGSNPFKKGYPPDREPAANMFDQICRSVHKSIEQDIFPRFKHTKYAMELLARLPSLAARGSRSSGENGTPRGGSRHETSIRA